ncbi:MAG TPA: hypothetical protein VKE96_29910 [Vicinamibacterales bacterium]|nr:hypothetical protein [Vicinamibacterales bacterium]
MARPRFHVIGDFFNTASRDATDSIFTNDIGVVGYVTPFRIYDALGIVDRTIAHSAPATAGRGMAGHEKQDLEYSCARQPTFVMYTVQLRPQPAGWPPYPAELVARVQADYGLKSVWLQDPQNRERGYFTYLERRR